MFRCRTRSVRATSGVSSRWRYLFGVLTLTLSLTIVAISTAFNMTFLVNVLLDESRPFLHEMMTTITTTMATNTKKKKTIALYICNDLYNKVQIQKVRELETYFGPNLFVVTDERNVGDNWILPGQQIISPDSNVVNLTAKLALSPPPLCCGTERSVVWLIQNQEQYDYAWVMEDDLHWTNFTDFADFFDSYRRPEEDATDLLHSNYGMEETTFMDVNRWWPYKRLLPPYVTTPEAAFRKPFHEGNFQFYRTSSRFMTALDDWRLKNEGEWTFFESLFANLAYRHDTNVTTKNFINNSIGYDFYIRWRPCYDVNDLYNITNITTGASRGGLFHPVKKDASTKNCRIQGKFVLQQKRRKKQPMRMTR